MLHQFGGTYLDLDALIIQPLPDLLNFLGRESIDHEFLAAGVLKSISYFKKLRPIFPIVHGGWGSGPGGGVYLPKIFTHYFPPNNYLKCI